MKHDPNHPTQPTQRRRTNPLKYTFDGHFLPTTPPDDDTSEDSNHRKSENGDSSRSSSSSTSCSSAGLAASLQVIANSMVRMEVAQLEMMKKRETDRLEAQMRRAQVEDEMTRMTLQTQSQIALFLHHRKRKRPQS